MKKEFNLSKHRKDFNPLARNMGFWYREEYVKEFIKLLQEYALSKNMGGMIACINKLAGDKLT